MLLFRVGATTYAVDVAAAHEIIPLRRITRLPGAPAHVRGLINVRGTIVTVLDLGARLEPSRAPLADGSILLVRRGHRLVGLLVEEVSDVRTLDLADVHTAESSGSVVRGVADVDGAPVVVLDLDALITQVLLS